MIFQFKELSIGVVKYLSNVCFYKVNVLIIDWSTDCFFIKVSSGNTDERIKRNKCKTRIGKKIRKRANGVDKRAYKEH